MKSNVLFVCVENSCRSQMAEGFARALGRDIAQAFSAGSRPSGKINATAIKVMREKGVPLDRHLSKGLSDLPKVRWDYIITMGCGDVCPLLPAKKRLDWNLPDPKILPLSEFRRVRDMIEARVRDLLHEIRG